MYARCSGRFERCLTRCGRCWMRSGSRAWLLFFLFLRFCVTGLIFLLIAEDWIRGKVVKKQSAVVCGSRDGSVASRPAPRPCLHLLRKSFCMMSVVRSIASSWRPCPRRIEWSGSTVCFCSVHLLCLCWIFCCSQGLGSKHRWRLIRDGGACWLGCAAAF